jgi:hypothetical protein
VPKLIYAILCDDVRREQLGKHILIGTFENFTMSDFTQTLPPFKIFARVAVDYTDRPHDLSIRITSENNDFHAELGGMVTKTNHSEAYGAPVLDLSVGFGSLVIPAEGRYQVSLIVDGVDLGGPWFNAEKIAAIPKQ